MKSNMKLALNQNIDLDEISDGWWELNLETNVCFFSRKFKKKLGYSEAEKLDLPKAWHRLIHAEDLQLALDLISQRNKPKNKIFQPVRYIHKEGQTLWSIFKGKIIKNASGKDIKVIGIHIDITAIKEAEEKLQTLALYDSLTNLPNRFHFLENLGSAIARTRRHRNKLAVFFLDVDNLKYVNDTFGHGLGDHLLMEISKLLVDNSRATDFIARLGGDEFGIIIEDIQIKEDVETIANRYIKAFEKIHNIKECKLTSTVSIGIAIFPKDGKSSEELIRNADRAMYKAKSEGKNNFICFNKIFA